MCKTQTLPENRTRFSYARAASLAMLCLIRCLSWTLDFFFGREIEEIITVRDVEALSDRLACIRARAKRTQQMSADSALTNSAHSHP